MSRFGASGLTCSWSGSSVFLAKAVKRVVQDDGRIRYWIAVQQTGEERSRWLRIICLDDDETLHNAFLDRDFEEPSS